MSNALSFRNKVIFWFKSLDNEYLMYFFIYYFYSHGLTMGYLKYECCIVPLRKANKDLLYSIIQDSIKCFKAV